jgi:membrane protein DedA with SNARE-associated domain
LLQQLHELYLHVVSHFDFDVLELIQAHSLLFYPITVVWTFFEGETFIIVAGYAAHRGLLNMPALIAAAWVGSFAGDQLWFFLGRRYGQHLLRRFPRWLAGVETALGLARRYNTVFILSFRFIYGIRNVSSFALGMSGLQWTRFCVLNLIAAGVWSITFAGSGYLFGEASAAMFGEFAQKFGLVALLALLLVVWAIVSLHRRHRRKIAEAGSSLPPS